MTIFFLKLQIKYVLFVSLLALVLVACSQKTYQTHEIQVQDLDSGNPIAGAMVTAETGVRYAVETKTDAEGIAEIALDIDQLELDSWIKLSVAADDYQPEALVVDLNTAASPIVVKLSPPTAEQPVEAPPHAEENMDTTATITQTEEVTSANAAMPAELPAPGELAAIPAAERADYYQAKPELTIDPNATYRATIKTAKGDIVLSLNAQEAPEHVNNFVFLSNQGFYDGLAFHRVEPGFVIQGGDPVGNGTGGPGYTVPGEFNLKHIAGALAMARQPDQVNPERASSGSQFYITLAPTPQLDDQYSVFGQIEAGMDVVQAIAIGDVIERIIIEQQ